MKEDSSVGKPEDDNAKAKREQNAPPEESRCNQPQGRTGIQSPANYQPPPTGDNHPDQSHKGNKSNWHRLKDILETVGLFVGIGVGIVIYFQYGEMAETNKEMHQAFVADNRAWVTPFEMVVEESPQDTNLVSLKLMFKNTGKTPALNISATHGIGFPEAAKNLPPAIPGGMMLGPDVATFLRVPNIRREFVSPSSMFFVYGRMNYDDIFGNHHWTEFCWGPDGPAAFQGPNWAGRNTCDDDKQREAK